MPSTDSSRNNEVCIFTIASRNYLHYAKTLMQSVHEYCPDADLVVGLCDVRCERTSNEDLFTCVELASLDNIPELEKFMFRYTILELNTAIKPYIFEKLFERGYSKVIYFDPDICVYSSLDRMLAQLESQEMLLTPHITRFLDDGKRPSELDILVSGTYNLGYLGLRKSPQMSDFLHWWQAKLYEECVVDVARGIFVDQKWIDLAPGLFRNVSVVRNEGWNVANWNLNHRTLSRREDGKIFANEDELVFFHFSGFSLNDDSVSRHQTRFNKRNICELTKELYTDYGSRLIENGYYHFSNIEYHYNFLSCGTRIPDLGRHFFRNRYDWKSHSGSIWTEIGSREIISLLNSEAHVDGKANPFITNLSYELYCAREDLQRAFPKLNAEDGIRYAAWFVGNAEREAGFASCFVEPIKERLNLSRVENCK